MCLKLLVSLGLLYKLVLKETHTFGVSVYNVN